MKASSLKSGHFGLQANNELFVLSDQPLIGFVRLRQMNTSRSDFGQCIVDRAFFRSLKDHFFNNRSSKNERTTQIFVNILVDNSLLFFDFDIIGQSGLFELKRHRSASHLFVLGDIDKLIKLAIISW